MTNSRRTSCGPVLDRGPAVEKHCGSGMLKEWRFRNVFRRTVRKRHDRSSITRLSLDGVWQEFILNFCQLKKWRHKSSKSCFFFFFFFSPPPSFLVHPRWSSYNDSPVRYCVSRNQRNLLLSPCVLCLLMPFALRAVANSHFNLVLSSTGWVGGCLITLKYLSIIYDPAVCDLHLTFRWPCIVINSYNKTI